MRQFFGRLQALVEQKLQVIGRVRSCVHIRANAVEQLLGLLFAAQAHQRHPVPIAHRYQFVVARAQFVTGSIGFGSFFIFPKEIVAKAQMVPHVPIFGNQAGSRHKIRPRLFKFPAREVPVPAMAIKDSRKGFKRNGVGKGLHRLLLHVDRRKMQTAFHPQLRIVRIALELLINRLHLG